MPGDETSTTPADVTFTAVVERTGANTTGIRVPDHALGQLGQGKRPKVEVTFDSGYSFRTTVGSHGGAPYLSVSAAVREEGRLAAGEEVRVSMAADLAPRETPVPDDLAAALRDRPEARAFFDRLTDSQRKTFITSVTSARRAETRERRVSGAVSALADGRKRP